MNKYNVLEAAEKRLEIVFSECDQVYLSISGGKDSGVMAYLANKIALEQDCVFDIFILDIEANYQKASALTSRMTKTVRFL